MDQVDWDAEFVYLHYDDVRNPSDLEQSREYFDNYIEYAPNPTPAILERLRSIGYQI